MGSLDTWEPEKEVVTGPDGERWQFYDHLRYTDVYKVNKMHPDVIERPQRFSCHLCERLLILPPGLSFEGALKVLGSQLFWSPMFKADDFSVFKVVCDSGYCFSGI